MWYLKYIMNRPHIHDAIRLGVLPIAFNATLCMMIMDDRYKRRNTVCG